ncbi:MAG TPA: Hsp20/alpha crystallin family protein [Thermodesulfobacteriota bacterium]|nr:Hsp20/alpha crystallin family protein [Thermodesulfobacteriota bacterium]
MRIKVWEPFRSFRPFYGDFDKWFEQVANSNTPAAGTWHPAVDVYETEDSYVLKADLPGVSKEDIKIDVNNNTLTIKGEKKLEEKTEKDNYVRVERSYGSFSRTFALSDKVDSTNIKAAYKDGVLEVTLPKKEEAKPKEIKVEIN